MKEEQDKITLDATLPFDKQVDNILSGADTTSSHLEVLKITPPLLRMVGVPNLPILMTARHVKTITQENGNDSANYHGLGVELVKRLPELISDPVMIMDSISPDAKAKNSVVIVTQMIDRENRPIIGAIRLAGRGNDLNGFEISANIMTSAYGKDNFQSFIERNIEQGSVLYVDKAKSQELFETPGIQFPDNFESLDFDTIIRKTKAFVNSGDKKNLENTEKKGEDMTPDANNSAQSARERVQQVRDEMVKTLLEHIEKNPTKWQAGWNNIAAGAPYNGKTNTAYRGINALYLAVIGVKRGYTDTRWVTFNQAKELGASVKKGEKSSPVIFFELYDRATKKAFNSSTVKDMTDEEKAAYVKENVYTVLKYSSVFNAEQCYNFPERKEVAMSEEERANQNVKIETIIANSAAPVLFDGGSQAYYSIGTDSIHLPKIEAFDSMQDYYATALHEIAHSTGHESRLNRDMGGGFGSESYAKEELRAELACIFMQMENGIQLNGKHITNHAAYLNSWLEAAKRDNSVFFKAAADAQKIADYVADNYMQAGNVKSPVEEKATQSTTENSMTDYLKADAVKRETEQQNMLQSRLNENIREWYLKAYPTDEAGQDIYPDATFKDLLEEVNRANPVAVYGMLADDSIVRERAFSKLAELTNTTYEDIYSAYMGETAAQRLANARAQAQRLAAETGEPYVTIEWSESQELNSYDVISLSRVDKRLAALDSQAENEEGYYKTKLHIDFVFEGEPNSYENCRFDIGSEGGGLVHHIDEFLKYDTFLSAEERSEVGNVLEYFKQHIDVSKYLASPERLADLSEEEQKYVNEYIERARDVLNTTVPFADYNTEMPLTPEELKARDAAREAAHAAGLPFYEGTEENYDGSIYDGNMSVEDYKRMMELQEQGTVVQENDNQRYYYSINEEAARRAKEMNSFSDYKEGSATAEYRRSVDSAIEIATKQKALVDPMYHERIDSLLNTYAKRLAANINESNVIDARMPSYLITGGGNFDVKKKQKQNDARDRNYQERQEIQGILDKIQSTGKGGISADDPNSIQKLTAKLESLEKSQEIMKAVNTYYRKNKTLDGCPELTAEQIAELREDMRQFPHLEGKPYPTWALSNNNAEIRRVKERIEELSKRQKGGFVGWEFDGGEVKANTVDNRLQIFFEEKPDEATRSELKHNGFKWSPKASAWQRQLTGNAYYAADRINAIQPLSGEKPTDLQRAYMRQHSADVAGNLAQDDVSSEQKELFDDAVSWYSMERPQLKLQDCIDAVREMDDETIREYAEQYRAYLDSASNFMNDERERTNYNYSASDLVNVWRENAQTEETTKEKLTLEEARNAMLDAQEQRQKYYAVRIENVPYTDPDDGYESEEPAQVIYTVSQTGRIKQYKTIQLDSDVFSSDLPYGGLISYELVEYEELEEIARKVRAPIQTYKDVLRAELEVGTERRRSDAYYDQRVEDILDEHYRTEYGLFERNIENPKYLSGTLYADETFRGERVVSLTKDESGKNVAIIASIGGSFAVAEDYHTDDGRNWGKYHSFDDQKSAEEFRAEKFGKLNNLKDYDKWKSANSQVLQEYLKIKYENPSYTVFYRLGDFYEVFGADAEKASQKLDLTLTGRDVGTTERIPMCGVPNHKIDEYAAKFADAGESIVIADGKDIRRVEATKSERVTSEQSEVKIQEMSNTKNEKSIADALTGNSVWLKINLPESAIGNQYGNNTLVRMPDGEFSHFGVFIPSKFIKNENGKVQLNVGSKFTYRLSNDGREVNLTGQELADSFAGKTIGKEIVRVAPSRKYAQTLANLEKNVPTELKNIPTWCCYRTKWNEEKGKKDKFIISPMDGKWASLKEPDRWTTFDAALKYARENNCEGLSLLLDKQYGITCIDLDKCITNVKTGEMKERATKLVKELEGTYIERSTSGNGVHIFLKDDILKNGTYNSTSMTKDDDPKGDLEVFDDKHIISMTGDMLSANNNLTRAGSAATVYLRQELGERRQQSSGGIKPQTHNSANLSDKELIQWIQRSKQSSKFNELYYGKGVSGDRSADDGKLAHMLLYFNGGDKEQVFRIMRESGLNRTDKPDSYYRHTIDKMDEKITEYAKRPSLGASKQQGKSAAGSSKPRAQA